MLRRSARIKKDAEESKSATLSGSPKIASAGAKAAQSRATVSSSKPGVTKTCLTAAAALQVEEAVADHAVEAALTGAVEAQKGTKATPPSKRAVRKKAKPKAVNKADVSQVTVSSLRGKLSMMLSLPVDVVLEVCCGSLFLDAFQG
jgi:hypothetical protein